ncbi:MAG: late competence development ComFB family protein [Thalassolituus sp.]
MSFAHRIRNYYEQMVADEIVRQLSDAEPAAEAGMMADIACVALNRLPPRYIRYEVDMAFYMSPDELVATRDQVSDAVTEAIRFVEAHRREEDADDDVV